MTNKSTAAEPRRGSGSNTPRIVATAMGLGMTATSVPCVAFALHDVITGAENMTGAIIIGSFFAVLLAIGLGVSWWGIFSKRWGRGGRSAEVTEHQILTAARALQGKVTPATLAVETGLTLDQAEANLKEMVDRGVAETWVSEAGNLVYAFPAFANPEDRLTAQDPLAVFDAELDASDREVASAEEAEVEADAPAEVVST